MSPNVLICQHILTSPNNIKSAFQAILATLGFPEYILGKTSSQIHFENAYYTTSGRK